MMKKAVLLLLICVSSGWLFANHWTPNDSDYEDNMTLTGIVQINGIEQQSTTLEVGAFCGEECRGSGYLTYFFPTEHYVIQLLIFGETGDQMTFKLYDSNSGQELSLVSPEPVTFNANGYGTLSEPYVLDFTGTGNTPHWVPNESEYEDNMTLTGVIQINGVEQQSTTLEVGVFCGEECRGASMATYFFPTQRYVVQLLIFGESGDQLTFKLFDHAIGQELNLTSPDAVTFVANGYGSLGDPYVLNFTDDTPSPAFHFIMAGNWSNAANWSGGALPGANDAVFIDVNCSLNMNAEVAALTITSGKTLTLCSGKTLTVTGTLTNMATTGLVIEDGAQLVHASENVAATVKKSIAGYGTGEGNWCLIACPMVESIVPSIGNGLLSGNYDLYSYSPIVSDGLEWRNYKQDHLMLLGSDGYLYANEAGTELSFKGILVPSNSNYVKNVNYYEGNSSLGNGWTLLGNPFVCECYLVDANGNPLIIYKMKAEGTGLDAVESGPIAPFEGFFYYTPVTGNVYFSKIAPAKGGVKD